MRWSNSGSTIAFYTIFYIRKKYEQSYMYSHRYITSLNLAIKKNRYPGSCKRSLNYVILNDCTLVRKSLIIVRIGGPQ